MAHSTPLVFLFALLSAAVLEAESACKFPEFLVRIDPWVADYKRGNHFLVAYIKENYMDINEPRGEGQSMKYKRNCYRQVTDTKYIVKHLEPNQSPFYACIEFLQRADNIVQLNTSNLTRTTGDEMCDSKRMALDAFPLINSKESKSKKLTCPFVGGYNMKANFHNKSTLCSNSPFVMRLESECDKGEGITIDFRETKCVPPGLPRTEQQTLSCVAHWTQTNYTFIILRHSEEDHNYLCMRISDPLSDIRSAYLWFQATCDSTPEPDPRISTNYILMNFTRRLYSSACEDEDGQCDALSHLCTEESLKRQCAKTCKQCITENQMGLSPFEEQYRGSWVESSTTGDVVYNISSYTLSRGQEVTYDCLRMDEDVMKEKRVLLELSNNGCLPRYACVEMSKVTSSVMRFRLGQRITWPLPSNHNKKNHICNERHFQAPSRHSHRGREEPHRLLVNTGRVQEVNCEIPTQFQNGIAFNEEDTEDRVCEGCLNFSPQFFDTDRRFVIQPTNCSVDSGSSRRRNQPIHYSCLASFNFRNRSRGVITKTLGMNSGVGQYLAWVFTSKEKIQVMKSAEMFILEHRQAIPESFLEVEFSVQTEKSLECRANMVLPPTTTTLRPQPIGFGSNPWDGHYPDNNQYGYKSDGGKGSDVIAERGYKTLDPNEASGRGGSNQYGDGGRDGGDAGGSEKDNPRFDTSRRDNVDNGGNDGSGKDDATSRHSHPAMGLLVSLALGVTFLTPWVISSPLRTPLLGHVFNVT